MLSQCINNDKSGDVQIKFPFQVRLCSIRMNAFRKVTVLLLVAVSQVAARNCVYRDYGYGGTVCVCNATYCDDTLPLPSLSYDEFALYSSSLSGLRFNLSKGTFNFNVHSEDESLTFTLNEGVFYQKTKGFGGAFTDSAGMAVTSLTPATQRNLLAAYFSKSGNAYTVGRIPIGGCDFSTRLYTYMDSSIVDTTLASFNLTHEDFQYKIPLIHAANELSEGSLRLLAAAWTAPPWMKTNKDYIGVGSLKKEYYGIWSDYHIKFLEEYSKQGIKIWALSTGNEPLNGNVPFFPFNCMGWTPETQRLWVLEHMGPALQRSEFNETLLMGYDDQRIELRGWLENLFKNGDVSPFIAGVGVHWYWDNVAPLSYLDEAHNSFPELFIMATEASFTKKKGESEAVHLGSWERGEIYAESVIDDMNHWVAGWVDWNLALNPSGGPNWADNVVDAAIIVNSTADEFYKQPMFYALGHFSKFVPPDSVRVDLTGGSTTVKGVAFKTPDNLLVAVILNKEDNDMVVGVRRVQFGTITITVPAKSISTIVFRSDDP